MQVILLIFLSAIVMLFITRKVARRVGLVDKPKGRKVHTGHVPLVGGLSIYLSLWLLFILQPHWLPGFSVYMLCITILLVTGVFDDRFDFPVLPRMILQVAVAVIMIWHGIYMNTLGDIIPGDAIYLGSFGYVLTILAVVGSINAFNMVDGIDGLLGALAGTVFLSIAIVFYMAGQNLIALWCIALLAACIPYIMLNIGIPWGRKFKVFMGDAGSMLIGFTVIWLLLIASQENSAVMHPVTALWLITLPLLDMVRVMMSRLMQGVSPFHPDREHLHHIVMRAGFGAVSTLVILTTLQVVSASFGLILHIYNVPDGLQLFIFILTYFILHYSVKVLRNNSTLLEKKNTNSI